MILAIFVPASEETKKLFSRPLIFCGILPDLSLSEWGRKSEAPSEAPTRAEPQESQPDSEFDDTK